MSLSSILGLLGLYILRSILSSAAVSSKGMACNLKDACEVNRRLLRVPLLNTSGVKQTSSLPGKLFAKARVIFLLMLA